MSREQMRDYAGILSGAVLTHGFVPRFNAEQARWGAFIVGFALLISWALSLLHNRTHPQMSSASKDVPAAPPTGASPNDR